MKPIAAFLAVGLMVTLGPPAEAQAQGAVLRVPKPAPPLVATAERDLTFGTVFPGVPRSIRSIDNRHSGMFEISGSPETSVRVEFLLPSELRSPSDAMPIVFGPEDGFADFSRGRPPRGLVFDPNTPVTSMLGPNGRLLLRLGGTVLPRIQQTSGEYGAHISITIFDLGS